MIDVRQRLQLPSGKSTDYYSLPLLETLGMGNISRLPVSVRIILESVVRHVDGRRIRDADVEALDRWQPGAARTAEVPFVVGLVLLQYFTVSRCSLISRRCVRRSRAAVLTSNGYSPRCPSIS